MAWTIPFNKPHVAGKELYYIAQAVALGNISGDGHFTHRCAEILEQRFAIPKVLMTTSCTSSLEMAALLCQLEPGDEVIMPSFTFVSTATAFVRAGAKPVFVDIRPDTLNLDEDLIEDAIGPRTRAIVPVHYAGVACAMDPILALADRYGLLVVEDAAQGVNAGYKGRALGSMGHLGCYSFHETKNYISGEGGALCINRPEFVERAEILRDKGTNRQRFLRGQVDKYTWVDLGSSYVPSEIVCAFLAAQLEQLDALAERRRQIFESYRERLQPVEDEKLLRLPRIPAECSSNSHILYILLPDNETADGLRTSLNQQGIGAVIHYVPLHSSPKGRELGCYRGPLPVTESVSARLLRLPMYYELSERELDTVAHAIAAFLHRR